MDIAIVDTETTGLNERIHGIWEAAVILHTPVVDGKGRPDEEWLWQLPADLSFADPDGLRISRFYERRWRKPPPMPPGFAAEEYFDDAVRGYNDDRFRPDLDRPPRDDERYQVPLESMHVWATRFAALTAGRILVGANPSFDEKRLSHLLREFGVAPAWHYRPICVEALAAGFIRGQAAAKAATTGSVATDPNRERDWFKALGMYEYAGDIGRGKIALPWSHTALARAMGTPSGSNVHTALGDCRHVRDLWVKIMEDG